MITTKNLTIAPAPLTPSFLQWTIDCLNDQEITKYSEQRHNHHTVETQIDYLRQFLHGPSHYYAICLNSENKYIGTISAIFDEPNKVADVGILIGDKTQWGKGYGYEAWEAVCDDLLYSGGIRKIEAGCMFKNKAMLRIFKRYRMVFDGVRHLHFQIDGEFSDMVMYGKFAP